jgi:hypothetical protein
MTAKQVRSDLKRINRLGKVCKTGFWPKPG